MSLAMTIRIMKRPVLFISFIFSIVVGLTVIQVGIMNQMTTTGIELVKIEKELTMYRKENTILEEQLLASESLTNISGKAKRLGFVDSKSQVYFSTPLPLALNQ